MDFDIKDDGSLTTTFMDGGKYAYGKALDFKAFYIELGNLLTDKGWDDITWDKDPKFFSNVDATSKMKKGELADTGELKRNKNMYEQNFVWSDKGDGSFDVELLWMARKSSDIFGGDNSSCVMFKLNMANRRMMNKEILDGNNKTTLQEGTWEFRNEMKYKNVYFREKFKKLKYITKWTPFSESYLQEVMVKMWYEKEVDQDIALFRRKAFEPVSDLIRKYFT